MHRQSTENYCPNFLRTIELVLTTHTTQLFFNFSGPIRIVPKPYTDNATLHDLVSGMASTSNNEPFLQLRRFFQELRRRKVYRVAVVYIIGAVAGLELISVLIPASRLPSWADELFLGLAVFGFPLVVILAWAFEITPDGVRLTRSSTEKTGKMAWPGIALTLVMIASTAVWWSAIHNDGDSASPERAGSATANLSSNRPFVAVLPLDNMSPDEANAYFASGVHEEILAQLSKVSSLGVFARTTMNQYKDSDQSIFEIGQDLGASAVLEGSVRRDGDRVRITAQLIDPVSRDHLWSESYDRNLDDVFAVQSDIARRVVRSLEATLSPKEESRILSQPTESLAAYDLYLKGREAYRRIDGKSNQEAIRLFESALELDPNYALAWAGLADTYAQRNGRFGYPHGPSAETAERHALKALEIDPELAEGHKAIGYAYQSQGKYDESLTAYFEAIAHDPNNFEAWNMVGVLYYQLGQYDESVRHIRRAALLAPTEVYPRYLLAHGLKFLKLDDESKKWASSILILEPRHVGAKMLDIQFIVYEGNMMLALDLVEKLIEDSPDDAFALTGAAGVAFMAGDYARAAEWADESLRISPDNSLAYWHTTRTLLALSLHQIDPQKGDDLLDQALEDYGQRLSRDDQTWSLPWDLAAIHAARGNDHLALEWLNYAYDNGFRFVRWPPINPVFDKLQEDPQFRKFMAQMETDVAEMRYRLSQEEQQ